MGLSIQVIKDDVATTLYPTEDIPVRLDISTIENGEIGDKFGSFSQQFTIARDETTKRFFEDGDEIADVGDIPGFFSDLDASIYSDNDLITHGLFSLESVNVLGGKYVCVFIGHDLQFFAQLDGRKVVDSDWSDLEHLYTKDTPFKSWTRPAYDNTPTEANDLPNSCRNWYVPDQDLASGEYAAVNYYDCEGEYQKRVITSSDNGFNIQAASGFTPIIIENTNSMGDGGYPSGQQLIAFTNINSGINNLTGPLASSNDPLANGDVFYPLIDQGYDGAVDESVFGFITTDARTAAKGSWLATQTPLKINQLTPAIKLSKVFEIACDTVGKRYQSDFIDNALNDCYIMPKAYDGLGIVADPQTSNGFRTNVQNLSFTHRIKGTTSLDNEVRGSVIVGAATGGVGDWANGPGTSKLGTDGKFTAPVGGTYEFYFKFDITDQSDTFDNGFLGGNGNQQQLWEIAIVTDNSSAATEGEDLRLRMDTSRDDEVIGAYTINRKFQLDADDKVWVRIRSTRNKGAQWCNVTFANYEFGTNQEPIVWDGITCNPGRQFPDDLEWNELIKSINQVFNFVIYPDENDRELIHIEPYYNWINDGQLINWSQKVDNAKGINKYPVIADQPRDLQFVMAEDDDVYNVQAQEKHPGRVLGSTRNVVTSESSKLTGDRVVGDFFGPIGVNGILPGALPETETLFNNGIMQVWEKDGNDKSAFGYAPRIGFQSKYRELGATAYISHSNDETDRREIEGYTTLVPISPRGSNFSTHWDFNSEFPQPDEFNDRPGAYDLFWKQYIDNLYDESNYKIECDVYLEPSDFQDLKGNNIFLINGDKFTYNKIKGFNLTRPGIVTVEMIRFYDNYRRLTAAKAKPQLPKPPPPDPRVFLTASTTAAVTNQTVTFTATVQDFSGTLTYSWYAIDSSGTVVALTTVSGAPHQRTLSRSVAGEVTVFVNVNNGSGDESIQDDITVNWTAPTPTPPAEPDPAPGVTLTVTGATLTNGRWRATPGTTINVTATVTDFTGTTDWDVQGQPATGVTAGGSGNARTYTRSTAGVATVQATVSNDNGTGQASVVLEWVAAVVNTAPEIVTVNFTGALTDRFQMNGYLTSNGGANITDQGFYYVGTADATQSQVLAGTKKALSASDRNIVGPFSTATNTDLTADTVYSFMAYATNSVGTTYGEIVQARTRAAAVQSLSWAPSSLTFGTSSSSKTSTVVNQNLSTSYVVSDFRPITGGFTQWARIERVGLTQNWTVTVDDIPSSAAITFRVGQFTATHTETGHTANLYITQNFTTDSNDVITVSNASPYGTGYKSYGRAAGIDGIRVTTNPTWVRWISSIEYNQGSDWITLSPPQAFGTTTQTIELTRNSGTTMRSAEITYTACDTNWNPLHNSSGDRITATYSVVQTTFERVLADAYFLDTAGNRLPGSTISAQPDGGVTQAAHSKTIRLDLAPSTATWTATVQGGSGGGFGTPSNGSWLTLNTTSGTGPANLTWTAASNVGGGSRMTPIRFVFTTGTDTRTIYLRVVQQSGTNGGWLPGGSGISVPQFGSPSSSSVTHNSATVQVQWYSGGATNTSYKLYYGTQSTKALLKSGGTSVNVTPNNSGVISRALSSLSASTTYRYFFEAVNSKGTGESVLQSFSTTATPTPPAPTPSPPTPGPPAPSPPTPSPPTPTPANQNPTASISGNTTGTVGTAVALSGTGSSDTDGTIASYAWNVSGTGCSLSSTTASTTNLSATAAGTCTVSLTVTDDDGATSSADTHSVTFAAAPTPPPTPANQNPVASISGNTSGTVGTAVALSGTGSTDSDGTIASYAWTVSGTGCSLSSTTASTTNLSATAAGTCSVSLTVTDDDGATSSADTHSVTFAAAPTPPPASCTLTSVTITGANDTIEIGNTETLGATVSSSGSCSLTYSWTAGNNRVSISNASTSAPTITGVSTGKVIVTCTVSATGATNVTDTHTYTVTDSA